ncbi:MAG: heme ABC transporter ATP-binding protein [Microscillaceae bacterium]|nr:heme ABC transporter ATP-binding protein [Microscillaceae bacterium]MDW8460887.1 heme ABC transporter ATP-binding protein [Cytophagales bacterium]
MPIEVQNVSYQTKQRSILHDISLLIPEKTFTAILGKNGAGKSTLLRCIAGELSPQKGKIYIDNQAIEQYKPIELARKRAVLSQHTHISFPIQVKNLIALGRINFKETQQTQQAVLSQIMHLTQTEQLAELYYEQLSGGERQRVHIARTLAQLWHENPQNNRYLLLDEPTTALDVSFQHQLLDIIQHFAQKQHITVIAILHDINLAIRYAQNIVFLYQGNIIAQGEVNNLLQKEILEKVFGCNALLINGEHPCVFWQYSSKI